MYDSIQTICNRLTENINDLNPLNLNISIRLLYQTTKVVKNKSLSLSERNEVLLSKIKELNDILKVNLFGVISKNNYSINNLEKIPDMVYSAIIDMILEYKLFRLRDKQYIVKVPDNILEEFSFDTSSLVLKDFNKLKTNYLIMCHTNSRVTLNGIFRLYLFLTHTAENLDISIEEFFDKAEEYLLDDYLPKKLFEDFSSLSEISLVSCEKMQDNLPSNIICIFFFSKQARKFLNPVFYLDVNEDLSPFCLNVFNTISHELEFITFIDKIFKKYFINDYVLAPLMFYCLRFSNSGLYELDFLKTIKSENDLVEIKFESSVDFIEDMRTTIVLVINDLFMRYYDYDCDLDYLRVFYDHMFGKNTYEYLVVSVNRSEKTIINCLSSFSKYVLRVFYYMATEYLCKKHNMNYLTSTFLDKTYPSYQDIWTDEFSLDRTAISLDKICTWVIKSVRNKEIYFENDFNREQVYKSICILNYFFVSPVNYLKLNKKRIGITDFKFKEMVNNLQVYDMFGKDNNHLGNVVITSIGRIVSFYNRLLVQTDNPNIIERFKKNTLKLPARVGDLKYSKLDELPIIPSSVLIFYFPDTMLPIYYSVKDSEIVEISMVPVHRYAVFKPLSTKTTIYINADKLYKVQLEPNIYEYIMQPVDDVGILTEDSGLSKTNIFGV